MVPIAPICANDANHVKGFLIVQLGVTSSSGCAVARLLEGILPPPPPSSRSQEVCDLRPRAELLYRCTVDGRDTRPTPRFYERQTRFCNAVTGFTVRYAVGAFRTPVAAPSARERSALGCSRWYSAAKTCHFAPLRAACGVSRRGQGSRRPLCCSRCADSRRAGRRLVRVDRPRYRRRYRLNLPIAGYLPVFRVTV